MTHSRRILVSAAGINSGGGLVLFESLVRSLKNISSKILLDVRLSTRYENLVKDGIAVIVKKSFFFRVITNIKFSLEARTEDVLFCFNSLPPIVRSKAFTVTYIHSPQFVGLHRNSTYVFRDRVRFFIEIVWFRLFYKNSDVLWVQTSSMKSLLLDRVKNVPIEVVPFIDDTLYELYGSRESSSKLKQEEEFSFFYPAFFTGHKNHRTLAEAFRKLAKTGRNVTLTLTLPDDDFLELSGLREFDNIINIGVVDRDEVIRVMRSSSALIFPSKAETFGIPLVEADALELPIIASELSFIRDVCTPAETFDPNSSDSIVDAVARFIGEDGKASYASFLSSNEFASKLYEL